ncbi:MAG: FecR domain-containing protein [Planctomycetota bacterium]|nr:FecR domain-containing protein [Planctomycetota bacterium]
MDTVRLEFLLSRYFDGELAPDEKLELQAMLLADADARRQFWRNARLHGALRLHGEQAWGERAAHESGVKIESSVLPSRAFSLTNISRWSWFAIAACLIVAVGLGFMSLREAADPNAEKLANTGNVASDPFLAIVIDQSSDTRWAGKDAPRGLGHALGRGRVRLENGEATLQLDNGVELQLRGPAELEMMSVDHGVLHRGQISARVPEQSIGFRLDAPGVNVVDLGTEFSLAVDGTGQPKVHVFKGKVRAGLPSMPESRTELNTGESARFDVALGKVSRGTEDPALFPVLEDDALVPHTTGDVRYLRRAPESVQAGTFEHDSIMVFEEQANIALPEEVIVLRDASNQQESSELSIPELVTLPSGTRVRSYYVHFDRVGRGMRDVESKGSITFDRPVLGLVIPSKTLKQTGSWLAHAGTSYELNGGQPLEMRFMGTKSHPASPNTSGRYDEVHLSEDGRTVTLDLLAGWVADQFRVLVEARPAQ